MKHWDFLPGLHNSGYLASLVMLLSLLLVKLTPGSHDDTLNRQIKSCFIPHYCNILIILHQDALVSINCQFDTT